MTADWSIRRQRERERREWRERAEERRRQAEQAAREQQRIAQTKNAWAEITEARAAATLAGYQYATYHAKARRLIRLVDGE